MVRRGPKPAPTAFKIVEGTRPSQINANEPLPTPSPEPPVAPQWLSEEARGVWNGLGEDLWRKGILTPWDVEQFAIHCAAVVRHREACELLAGQLLVSGARGHRVKNPLLQVVRDSAPPRQQPCPRVRPHALVAVLGDR